MASQCGGAGLCGEDRGGSASGFEETSSLMSEPAPVSGLPQTLDLKNRYLAAFLALLIPGLGHLYQGRKFKAGIYAVCILGLFFAGQAIGHWQVVYLADTQTQGRLQGGQGGQGGLVKRLLQGYGSQFPVGIVAWPAIIQSQRYHSETNSDRLILDAPLTRHFKGGLWTDTVNGPELLLGLDGTVTLESAGAGLQGGFEGTAENGDAVSFKLARIRDLGRPVSANPERTLDATPESLPAGVTLPAGGNEPALRGGLDRPFLDRYQVPLGKNGENRLMAELGAERSDMAYVFTWIAGLLNILAIWDALDGPAYGFGNEPELNQSRRRRRRRDEEDATATKTDKLATPSPSTA